MGSRISSLKENRLSLLNLPRELRDRIIGYLLVIESRQIASFKADSLLLQIVLDQTIFRIIKIGNRQLLQEAQELFYAQHSFAIAPLPNPRCECRVMRIGPGVDAVCRRNGTQSRRNTSANQPCTLELKCLLPDFSIRRLLHKVEVTLTHDKTVPTDVWMLPLYQVLSEDGFVNVRELKLGFWQESILCLMNKSANGETEQVLWNHDRLAQLEATQLSSGNQTHVPPIERGQMKARKKFLDDVVTNLAKHSWKLKKFEVVGCDSRVKEVIEAAVVLLPFEKLGS
ncbi:hypothetical protein K402DRAFT_408767 [Aulographum hederae CBS 113979]|uniref:Uncharacterized protein n=1 Tax=Aulographum hederae CBS 113979 TaxID=1176131 RepID=A0A6G1GJ90_9PEZI|nr:hypothetical protein K402DRAFT_408767 [Aulographum hederae CBS 113979]